MVDERLIQFFKEGIKKGNSLSELRQILIGAGWQESLVQEAYKEMSLQSKKIEEPKLKTDFSSPPIFQKKKNFISNQKKIVPFGTKVVAMLHFFIACLWFLSLSFYGGLTNFFGTFLGNSALIFNFIFSFVFGIFPFVIGLGLWFGKFFWRNVSISFSSLFLFISIFFIFQKELFGIFLFAIHLCVLGILLFDKKVKNYYS